MKEIFDIIEPLMRLIPFLWSLAVARSDGKDGKEKTQDVGFYTSWFPTHTKILKYGCLSYNTVSQPSVTQQIRSQ